MVFYRWTSEGFACLFLLNCHYLIFIFMLLCNKRWKSLFFHSFSGHTCAAVVHCFPVPLKFFPFLVCYRKYLSVYIIRGKKRKSLLKVIKVLLLPLPLGLSMSVKKGNGCFTPDTSICIKIMRVGKDHPNILTYKWKVEFSSEIWNKSILYLKANASGWMSMLENYWIKKKANKKTLWKQIPAVPLDGS